MMRRVAILASGPSLRLYDPGASYDAVIGTNHVIAHYPCHWWCFRDWRVFQDVRPKQTPLIFTSQSAEQRVHQQNGALGQQLRRQVVVHHEAIEFPLARRPVTGWLRWNVYSGLAALGLAWHLDAEQVDVFGMDLAGTTDFLRRPQLMYTNDRWQRQRLLWGQMVTCFHQAGRRVHRILAAPAQRTARNRLTPVEPEHD